jgi:hypothetical protein
MYSATRVCLYAVACLILPIVFTSCFSGSKTVKQPTINASSAGTLAIQEYDKDGDGKVAGDELEKAPALKSALKNLDTNGDGAVTADEVTARVNVWKEMKTAMAAVQCKVTLDGEPLGGATVVFEPEAFLGENIKKAEDVSTMYGDAAPTIAPEDRPDPKLPGGVNLGLYKVRISKMVNGKDIVPARYNKETILGQEVSYDAPEIRSRKMVFALKSK